MGKIGRFHPFISYIVLLRMQKTTIYCDMPVCNSLKIPRERSHIGSSPISGTQKGTPCGCLFACFKRGVDSSCERSARRLGDDQRGIRHPFRGFDIFKFSAGHKVYMATDV